MADSTLAITLSRSDDPSLTVSVARFVEDAGRLEGPGRRTIPAGDGSTEYTLWTSTRDGSGSAFTDRAFDRMVLVVDPDNELAATDPDGELGLYVKLYYTAVAGGSSTALGTNFFVRRNAPFVVPAELGTGVAKIRAVTKIAVLNADATNDITISLDVEVPA